MQDDMITYLIHELNLCIYSLNKYVFSVHMLQYNAKCLIISELPKHPCDFWCGIVDSNLSNE